MLNRWASLGGINAGLSFDLPFEDAGAGIVNTTPRAAIGSPTPTFTRATTATTVLSTGLIGSVASGQPRSCYTGAGVYLGYLSEQASTNLCLQSENFGTTWSAVGTPTRSAGAKTCGSVSLDLIGDDDGAALEGYQQVVTFTGDGVKALSFFFSQGTSTTTMVDIADATALATRARAVITWTGAVPTVTVSTGALLATDTLGNSVFRVRIATAAITAANTNNIRIFPASQAAGTAAETGNIYVGGVQVENNTFCTSYIPTTTGAVARNVDSLSYAAANIPTGTSDGTIAMEYRMVGMHTVNRQMGFFLSDAGNNRFCFRAADAAANSQYVVGTGAAVLGEIVNVTPLVNTDYRFAARYGTSLNAYQNGVDGIVAQGATNIGTASLFIGCGSAGGQELNGTIRNLKIWRRALADNELQLITT